MFCEYLSIELSLTGLKAHLEQAAAYLFLQLHHSEYSLAHNKHQRTKTKTKMLIGRKGGKNRGKGREEKKEGKGRKRGREEKEKEAGRDE